MEETAQGQLPVTEASPAPKPPADFTNVPSLSDADVRRAIAEAEKSGIDPNALTVTEMANLQKENPTPSADSPRISPDQTFNPNAVKLEVPDQFKNKDGEADVEKIKDSINELDEATQKKEEAVQKSVEDYLKEYKEKQTKFRNLPNPEKFADRLRSQEQAQPATAGLNDQQLREMILNDYRVDPLGTTTQLIEAAIARHLEPFSEEKRERSFRSNIETLAKEDPRVLNDKVYKAINAELDANPKLWSLDNPHEFAYLKVKERLRLGDSPRAGQAPPSRPPSPVLGAGAPPSAPSPSDYRTPKSVLETLDIRDKKQEALGDEMLRKALERKTY